MKNSNKTMHGAIITNAFYYSDGVKHTVDRLTEEFLKLGIVLETISNASLNVFLEGNNLVGSLGGYDFAIYNDKDSHIGRMIEKSGVRLFNNITAIENSDDKMKTYIALANNGILMPKTVVSPLMFDDKCEDNFLEVVESVLDYPIVIKQCYGSFGKQVFLANNRDEAVNIRNALKLKPHIYQQFISTSYGKDYRIMVVGGKAVSCMLRCSDTDFRSNLELGGKGTAVEPDAVYIQTAEKAAQILNLDFCGIDILIGENNQPVLCEVNSNAFFAGSERVCNVNIAAIYANHIKHTIYG